MDRRSFLGTLGAILGLGAAAAVAKSAEKVAELDAPPLKSFDPSELDGVTKPAKLGAAQAPWPDPYDGGWPLGIDSNPKPYPRAPFNDLVLPVDPRYVTTTGTGVLQAMGIQCPKCGQVGGPVCDCGWKYDNLFVGLKPNRTPEQIKAASLGYRIPDGFTDGFTSAEEFDRKRREGFEERLDRFVSRPPKK